MVQAWKIAPGRGAEDWGLFRKNNCIGIGWLPDSDYHDFRSVAELLVAIRGHYGTGGRRYGSASAKMVWQFVHEVKRGDVVVANNGYNRVVGIGAVAGEYLSPKTAENPIRKDTTTHRHHIRLVNWHITDRIEFSDKQFFAQRTLCQLKAEKLDRIRKAYAAKHPSLKAIVDRIFDGDHAGIDARLPEEIGDTQGLPEGAIRQVTVNAYERNPKARRKCIEAHGTTCCICGFRFDVKYGPIAEGYIHVHHIKPLSEVGEEYLVDPIEDLRPVCPNCHAVIHLGGECRSIEEVRQLITKHE